MERWRELMIAKLYDESTPAEEAELERALAEQPELEEEWKALVATREWLGAASAQTPEPAAPRVVIFPDRRRRITPWGFAAGVAASLLLFTVGWLAAPDAVEPELSDGQAVSLDTADAVLEALNRIDELEQKNARMEQRLAAADSGYRQADNTVDRAPEGPTTALLTRNEFEEGLARMLTRFDYQIQQESQYLLSEMAERDRRYIEGWRLVTREMPALSEQ